jgi:hypothetical protein
LKLRIASLREQFCSSDFVRELIRVRYRRANKLTRPEPHARHHRACPGDPCLTKVCAEKWMAGIEAGHDGVLNQDPSEWDHHGCVITGLDPVIQGNKRRVSSPLGAAAGLPDQVRQ